MSKLESVGNHPGEAYIFECPGCGMDHMVTVSREERGQLRPMWSFNGDMNRPTFHPSLLVKWSWGEAQEPRICHSFVKDGRIQFLNDCTHPLKGQTVELYEIQAM